MRNSTLLLTISPLLMILFFCLLLDYTSVDMEAPADDSYLDDDQNTNNSNLQPVEDEIEDIVDCSDFGTVEAEVAVNDDALWPPKIMHPSL